MKAQTILVALVVTILIMTISAPAWAGGIEAGFDSPQMTSAGTSASAEASPTVKIVGVQGPEGPAGKSIKGPKGDPGMSISGPRGCPGQDGRDGRDGEDAQAPDWSWLPWLFLLLALAFLAAVVFMSMNNSAARERRDERDDRRDRDRAYESHRDCVEDHRHTERLYSLGTEREIPLARIQVDQSRADHDGRNEKVAINRGCYDNNINPRNFRIDVYGAQGGQPPQGSQTPISSPDGENLTGRVDRIGEGLTKVEDDVVHLKSDLWKMKQGSPPKAEKDAGGKDAAKPKK